MSYFDLSKYGPRLPEFDEEEDELQPQPVANNNQGRIGDTIDALQMGAIKGTAGIFDMAGTLTGSNFVKNIAQKFYGWGDDQLNKMSERGRTAFQQQIFEQGEDGGFTLGAGATNFDTWLLNIANGLGQFAPIVAGGGGAGLAARAAGAAKGLQSAVTTGGYVAAGGSMATGMGGNEARSEVKEMPQEVLDAAPIYQNLVDGIRQNRPELDDNQVKERARNALAEQLAKEAMTDPKALLANFGMSAISDPILGRALMGARLGKGFLGSVGKGALVEAPTEFLQGGTQALVNNEVLSQVDGRDVWDGVLIGAANEAVIGGAVGGTIGGATYPFGRNQDDKKDQPPPSNTGSPISPGNAPVVNPDPAMNLPPEMEAELNRSMDPAVAAVAEQNPTLGAELNALDQASASRQRDVEQALNRSRDLDMPTAARNAGFGNSPQDVGRFGDMLTSPVQQSIADLESMRARTIADMVAMATQDTGPTAQDRFSPIPYQFEGEVIPAQQAPRLPPRQANTIDAEPVQFLPPDQQRIQRKDIIFAGNETGVTVKQNGQPFQSPKEALASKTAREAKKAGNQIEAVSFADGYGWQVVAPIETNQAVTDPNIAALNSVQDRPDGKTETVDEKGLTLLHGSTKSDLTLSDIQIIRSGQKQAKKGRTYGGFYATSESDIEQAKGYSKMGQGEPTIYDINVKPGTKVLQKEGDITRLSESYINELTDQGYGLVIGKDPRGRAEYVVIDKNAISYVKPRVPTDTNVGTTLSDQAAVTLSPETDTAPQAAQEAQAMPAINPAMQSKNWAAETDSESNNIWTKAIGQERYRAELNPGTGDIEVTAQVNGVNTQIGKASVNDGNIADVVERIVREDAQLFSNAEPAADLAGETIDPEWTAFADDTGTKKIPRAEMPQIKAEHRGAMVQFMKGRDITHEQDTVPAADLKPTQAEFSPAKVKKAMEFDGGNRSILVSSDGYVLDGHHQWLAAREKGEPVDVIRLNAPIDTLIPLAREFPSSTLADGAVETESVSNTSQAEQSTPKTLRDRKEAARKSKATKESPAVTRATNIIGAKAGDTIRIDGEIGYAGNADYYVQQINNDGTVFITNDQGTTNLTVSDLVAAQRRGEVKFTKLDAPKTASNVLEAKPTLKDRKEAARSSENAAAMPEVLTLSKNAYLKKQAQKQKLRESSPGYAQALSKLDEQYDTDYDRALAGLTFEQFNEVNKGVPESLNRQAYAQLREDFGLPDQPEQSANEPSAPIEDFGEKLGGARKDEYRMASQRIDDMTDQQIAQSTLSELFPKNELDKIDDPVSAAFYHVVRDEIPSKPRVDWKLKRWIDEVKAAREMLTLIDNENLSEKFLKELSVKGSASLRKIARRVELLSKLDRKDWSRIGAVDSASGRYRNEAGEMVPGSWYAVRIDGRSKHYYDKQSVDQIVDDVKQDLAKTEQTETRMKFEIRGRDGSYFINKTGDKDYTALKRFTDLKAARAFLNENYNDLVQLWDAVKQRENVAKADLRSNKNGARTGVDHRNGADVTPEQFAEAFGLRGVEFGNWVKQGKENRERQSLLNDAFDAFMDLASVLNIPPRAIGFGGKLGIGFGSRGRGGKAAAHYETGKFVINLTKTQGAGSLAHEWLHALDNYFSSYRGGQKITENRDGKLKQVDSDFSYITFQPEQMLYNPKTGTKLTKAQLADFHKRHPTAGFYNPENFIPDPTHPDGVRPEVEAAFAKFVNALDDSTMKKRSLNTDGGKPGYWSRIIERAARGFETYIISRLADQGYRNDFLANVTSFERFTRNPDKYPYLKPDEQGPINEALDNLFAVMDTKETDKGVMLFSKANTTGTKPAKGVPVSVAQREADKFVASLSGAAGIKVQVLPTQQDAEKLWRMSLDGDFVRGAYSDQTGTVYIIAENARNMTDLKQTIAHELFAHGGLDKVIGADKKQEFLNRLKGTRGKKEFKGLWSQIDRDYDGMSEDVKAEELFAYFVQNQPQQGPVKFWWNAFKRWLNNILANLGITSKGDPDVDLMQRMMESIMFGFQFGRQADSNAEGNMAFSKDGDTNVGISKIELLEKLNGELTFLHAKIKDEKKKLPDNNTEWTPEQWKPINELAIRINQLNKETSTIKREIDEEKYKLEEKKLKSARRRKIVTDTNIKDEFVKAVESIFAKGDFSNYGIRINSPNPLTGESIAVDIGSIASPSYYQPDGQVTEQQHGTSAIEIHSFDDVRETIEKTMKTYGDDGDSVVLLGSDSVYSGNDPGEIEMSKAKILAVLRQDNPDIMFSRTKGQPDTRTAREKIGQGDVASQTISDRIKNTVETIKDSSWWKAVGTRATEGIFDGLHGIKKAEEAAGITDPNKMGYVSARLATGLGDMLHALFSQGALEWKGGVTSIKKDTKGLLEVFGMLPEDNGLNNWLAWMAANRAEKLMAEGRENNLTEADIAELKALAKGNEALFEEVRKEYNKINSATLDLAEQAGLISAEQRAGFDEEWYVPFFREMDIADPDLNDVVKAIKAPFTTKTGIVGQSANIKALIGGTQSTQDLLQNIIQRQVSMIDAAVKNNAAREVAGNLDGTGFMTREDSPEFDAAVEALGLTRNELATKHQKVRIMENGKPVYFYVHDAALLRGLMQVHDIGSKALFNKMARSAKRFLTTGVTLSPDFIIRNFIRDAAHAWMVNKDGAKLGTDTWKGLKASWQGDPNYWKLIASGAAFQGGYIHGADPEAAQQQIRRALRANGMTTKQVDGYMASIVTSKDKLMQAFEKYRQASDKLENSNRMTVYERAIAAGKSERQALFESKDLMDYSLKGNFGLMGTLIDMLPFFNARLQGLYKLGRAAAADGDDQLFKVLSRDLAMKGLKVAAFSTALAAMYGDDERYKQLPEWDKDSHWHLFLGEGTDGHIRIPKPFELGIVFGTFPERLFNFAAGNQSGKDAREAVGHAVFNTLALNPVPQLVMPVYEVLRNKSSFTGAPIETLADQQREKSDRYDERTSDVTRALGGASALAGLSPKQVEHLVTGYTGTLGAYVLSMSDFLARVMTGREKASTPAADWPIVRTLYQGGKEQRNTLYQQRFIESLNKAREAYGSYKLAIDEQDPDRAQRQFEKRAKELNARLPLERVQRRVSDINKAMRVVERDTRLSSSEKKDRLQQLQRQKNEMYEQAYMRLQLREW